MEFTNTDCVHRSWRSDEWWLLFSQLNGTVCFLALFQVELGSMNGQAYKQISPIKYKIKQEIKK